MKTIAYSCLVALVLFTGKFAAHADEPCECAVESCKPCEFDAGMKLYSLKCGPGGSRTKSCKRPDCQPIANQKQCLAKLGAPPPAARATPVSDAVAKPASPIADEAGQVLDLRGEVQVQHANGVTERPIKREPAFVGDVYITKADGWVRISLRDGSETTVAANSRLRVEKVDVEPAALKRQIALQILAGRVRNRVEKEYKDSNYFQVRTKSAVAGVRGTDFIVSYDDSGKTEVRTLRGLVRLQAVEPGRDGKVPHVDIPAGTFAFTGVPAVEGVSPLYKIKTEDIDRLSHEDFLASADNPSTVVNADRSVASVETPVCKEPQGFFNQCSWTCVHNPKGESRCRTDLPNVKCVRHLCQANGKWEEKSDRPEREYQRCASDRVVVSPCDEYW